MSADQPELGKIAREQLGTKVPTTKKNGPDPPGSNPLFVWCARRDSNSRLLGS